MPEKRKHHRPKKAALGQFFTPNIIAQQIIDRLHVTTETKILEPGCGDGSFILPLIDKFLAFNKPLEKILSENIWAIELDGNTYHLLTDKIKNKYGYIPEKHNLIPGDFLLTSYSEQFFDYIIGNPPFGGTIALDCQDQLDKKYGRRLIGNKLEKIKKETYSFFIVKSIDLLKRDGKIIFISSDTFLTIQTMKGLRMYLMSNGFSRVDKLEFFSEETNYPMVILEFSKSGISDFAEINGEIISRNDIESTNNFSWTINKQDSIYFHNKKLKDYIICTSGMTTGKNAFFIREIEKNTLIESYDFNYFDDPISLATEKERARLNYISPEKEKQIIQMERDKITRRNIKITKIEPYKVTLPHPDYKYYNKANSDIIYSDPKWAIYWKDNGDAVTTFKKNGNWYLHGMGGKKFFEKEGFTWALIATQIKIRYLPAGYILDSGAPCGFLRDGVEKDELYFIMGWLLTKKANFLLKTYVNHTKNIQSKDIERMPYPFWVDKETKKDIVYLVKNLIEIKKNKEILPSQWDEILEKKFVW